MTENALIEIESIIEADGDKDTVRLTTTGNYRTKAGKRYIVYKESRAAGFEGRTITIKVRDKCVSTTRYGKTASTLIIEQGAVNLCSYDTPAGSLLLDITGINIENHLTDTGGKLKLEYSLSADGVLLSENTVNITVKEI